MKVYVARYRHEPDTPSDVVKASRHRQVAVEALHSEFTGLIFPETIHGEHGYEVTMEGEFVAAFRDDEGGPEGYIEELEVEDEHS